MKLIISLSGLVHKIRITSYNAWIRPVRIIIPTKVNRSIVAGTRHVRIGGWFYKLFSPINDRCANKIKKRGQNNYITCNSCTYNHAKNVKCKNMSPNKFGDHFDTFHRVWPSNHNHSSNLHPKNTIKFIKNIIINVPKLPGFLLKAIFLERINNLKENIR